MNISNELFFEQVEAEIAAGREVEIRVKGHSMRPLLRSERERVVLSPVDTSHLAVGDIVLFRFRGRHVLHRILQRKHDRFTLAGDGNYGATEHCTAPDIVAIVSAVIRPSGRIVPTRSLQWYLLSRCWLLSPTWIQKFTQRVLWKMKY